MTYIQIVELTGLNWNTVNRYLTEIRNKSSSILKFHLQHGCTIHQKKGMPETDQCVILIKEEDAKVFTDVSEKSNDEAIRQIVDHYDLIIDMEAGKHRYLGGDKKKLESSRRKLNRIESFLGNAKSRLSKVKRMHSSTFRFHLK